MLIKMSVVSKMVGMHATTISPTMSGTAAEEFSLRAAVLRHPAVQTAANNQAEYPSRTRATKYGRIAAKVARKNSAAAGQSAG